MGYQYLENKQLADALSGYIDFLGNNIKNLESENIKSDDALGRVTSCGVFARISNPHYNACAMDGIAVTAADTFGATETTPIILNESQFVIVDTGDPVPEGFDAVIMIEDVVLEAQNAIIRVAACAWQHIRQIGEDLSKGDMILSSYTKINPSRIGALLAGGITEIKVYKKIKVGIIPSGDELIPSGSVPKNGEILEFNSKVIRASLLQAGCEVKIYDIVRDKLDLIKNALVFAAKENDIVILNAGASAGRDDYTKRAIEETGSVFCHGIAIRPGKPTVLGVCGNIPAIGVPGYPVSTVIVIEYVVKPVIEMMLKNTVVDTNKVDAILSRHIVSGLKYQEFLRMKLGFVNEKLVAVPLARGAGVISSLANADGIAIIPCDSEGFEAGQIMDVSLLKPIKEIKKTLVITGSHDPMIDIMGDMLRCKADMFVSSSHVGSMGGIMAIMRGEAHIAPVHLLDTNTGDYNKSYIEKYIKSDVALIKGVIRMQGIMVKKGNPKVIKGISDLDRNDITYVNRQKGAGTRILLDYLLRKSEIHHECIYGYTNEEYTHTAVAAQIATGNADAGLGILSAANIFDLDFIPVANEEYDFIIGTEMLDNPLVKAFLMVLKSEDFRNKLRGMGGYRFLI